MTDSMWCPECLAGRHESCQKTLCDCSHPSEELTVSHSRVESFLRCARQEFYSYGRKLQKQETSVALGLGSAIHSVLEALYRYVLVNGGMNLKRQKAAYPDAVKAALARMEELYAEGFTDSDKRAPLRLIIEKYLQREPFIDNAWRDDDDRQWLIMAVEKEFRIEWDPETKSSYPFVVDLLAKDPDGYVIVIDNKGVYDLYSFEETELMAQIPKYIGALRALGYKIGNYGVYNMLRTRPDPKTKVRPLSEWAHALDFKVTGTRVLRSFDEQIVASQLVHELDQLTPEDRDRRAIRTHNKETCERMCDYRELCVAELAGRNTAVLLRSTYQTKKKRDKIEISLEVGV